MSSSDDGSDEKFRLEAVSGRVYEQSLLGVPREHRGANFFRALPGQGCQESTRRLELAFASKWAELNTDPRNTLDTLLLSSKGDPFTPVGDREWRIAQFVAATFAQWLGTPIGESFLRESFRNAGGELRCVLPGEKQRTC